MSEDTKGSTRLPVAATPAAKWLAGGQPDPHGDRYNCERAELAMGDLTDDELANGAFMNYDQPLNIAGIVAGTHSSPIAWMTAVKDRIRWLSRKLTDAQALLAEKDARIAQLAAHARGKNKALANALKEIERLKRTIEAGAENEIALVAERTELRAQLEQLQAVPAERGVVPPERDALRDVVAHSIGGDAYDCTRVWSAWGVGTMSEDDFVPLVEQDDRLYEIADAIIDEFARLNPAPATADSDVREVSE